LLVNGVTVVEGKGVFRCKAHRWRPWSALLIQTFRAQANLSWATDFMDSQTTMSSSPQYGLTYPSVLLVTDLAQADISRVRGEISSWRDTSRFQI
jgi:hypothetical protein